MQMIIASSKILISLKREILLLLTQNIINDK